MDNTYEKIEKEIEDYIESNTYFLAYMLLNKLPEPKQKKYKNIIEKKMQEQEYMLFPISSGI